MKPFDFVNSITFNKQDLFEDPQADKDYIPFIVNRSLSYFPDTIMYANEMNMHSALPKEWQFDFLRLTISKRKRFSKWVKKDPLSEDIEAVSKYYQYSTKKTLEILDILTEEQISLIKSSQNTGGR